MTVADLIAELMKLPADALVVIDVDDSLEPLYEIDEIKVNNYVVLIP
jgi:hypothetical protein